MCLFRRTGGSMKTLIIIKGGSINPIHLANGDVYDSSCDLVDGKPIFHSNYVNTDKTVGYAGGILSRGEYYGMKCYRADGTPVIKYFSKKCDLSKIKTDADIPVEMFTLPSDIPNPNHNGLLIITFVQGHAGGMTWDWSHGCVTHLNTNGYHEFDKLMACLKDYEIINIILR